MILYHTKEEAVKVAEYNQKHDPDWAYKVEEHLRSPRPNETVVRWKVAIFYEEHEFLGYL